MSDRNVGDAFRISYSDPLPDFVSDTPNEGGLRRFSVGWHTIHL